jgi:hypothetical protein
LPNHAVLSQNTPGDTVKNHENYSADHFEATLQMIRILIHCNSTQTKLCPCIHMFLRRAHSLYTELSAFVCPLMASD